MIADCTYKLMCKIRWKYYIYTQYLKEFPWESPSESLGDKHLPGYDLMYR